MTLTITHAKVDAIPDNAADAAAGKVLPSDWNADHVFTSTSTSSANSPILYGNMEQDARFTYDPATQGHVTIGTSDPAYFHYTSTYTVGQPSLGILGGSGAEYKYTALMISQFSEGINVGFVTHVGAANVWTLWGSPEGGSDPVHNPPEWQLKSLFGINYNDDSTFQNPIIFDDVGNTYINKSFYFMGWDPTAPYNQAVWMKVACPDPGLTAPFGSQWTWTFPTGPGSNHQMLQTDGSGTTSWSVGFTWDGTNIVGASASTSGTGMELDATGGGGDNIGFFSTGSANAQGAGKFTGYDLTANKGLFVANNAAFQIGGVFGWNSDATFLVGSLDTGASRVAAAVVGIGNGAQGNTSGIVLSDGNRGAVQIDFGAFPGTTDTTLAVAVTQISSGSVVECFVMPAATTDHSVDEHWLDPPEVFAGSVNAGVGFTIYAKAKDLWGGVTGLGMQPPDLDNLVYGKWQLGWRWS